MRTTESEWEREHTGRWSAGTSISNAGSQLSSESSRVQLSLSFENARTPVNRCLLSGANTYRPENVCPLPRLPARMLRDLNPPLPAKFPCRQLHTCPPAADSVHSCCTPSASIFAPTFSILKEILSCWSSFLEFLISSTRNGGRVSDTACELVRQNSDWRAS